MSNVPASALIGDRVQHQITLWRSKNRVPIMQRAIKYSNVYKVTDALTKYQYAPSELQSLYKLALDNQKEQAQKLQSLEKFYEKRIKREQERIQQAHLRETTEAVDPVLIQLKKGRLSRARRISNILKHAIQGKLPRKPE